MQQVADFVAFAYRMCDFAWRRASIFDSLAR